MPSPVVVVCVSQDGLEPTLNFFLLPILYLPSVEITGVYHLPWLFCILESDPGASGMLDRHSLYQLSYTPV